MRKEIPLFLRPAPGAKPEFLATVRPIDPNPTARSIWAAVVKVLIEQQQAQQPHKDASGVELVLDDYTREGWAWKPDKTGTLVTVTVESTDGRNKLPGFVQYLKQRQKSAYGRFGSTGVWIVSYVQQPQAAAAAGKSQFLMDCRIGTDVQKIPHCSLKPAPTTTVTKPSSQTSKQQQQPQSTTSTTPPKKGGLLGKLVGAQQRTNQHVLNSQIATVRRASATDATSSSNTSNAYTKTVPEVHAEFRQSCQDQMLDFDLATDQQILRVPIHMSKIVRDLPEAERSRITLDVLKYMVYEAAEEVNEEWIAVREPSEFLDEVVIVVYKEGAAPPEVLEEMNRAEVPDEVRGQQQAMQAERARILAQQQSRQAQQLEQLAHNHTMMGGSDGAKEDGEQNDYDDEDDEEEEERMAALNTKKRDRRTIEDYEREKRQKEVAKRGRS